MLTLEKDAYGTRGQLSLVADFIELRAWAENLTIHADALREYLRDKLFRIPRLGTVPLHDDSDDGQLDELPEEAEPTDHATANDRRAAFAKEDAQRVFQLLLERGKYLGGKYPYDVVNQALSRRCDTVVGYDVVHAIALRHGCLRDDQAAYDFEDFVERCLRAQRYQTFALAPAIRKAPGSGADRFRSIHKEFSALLSMRLDPQARVSPKIHDGGADVLARIGPADDRPGCRTLLVQATVGRAETWHQKLHQPKVSDWAQIFGDPVPPSVTLAVPHHIELDQLGELVRNGMGGTVFDRLRLVAHDPEVTADDQKMVEQLLADGVEW